MARRLDPRHETVFARQNESRRQRSPGVARGDDEDVPHRSGDRPTAPARRRPRECQMEWRSSARRPTCRSCTEASATIRLPASSRSRSSCSRRSGPMNLPSSASRARPISKSAVLLATSLAERVARAAASTATLRAVDTANGCGARGLFIWLGQRMAIRTRRDARSPHPLPSRASQFAKTDELFHEAPHELRNLIGRGIEREVACIEDVDFRLRHVAAIGLRF